LSVYCLHYSLFFLLDFFFSSMAFIKISRSSTRRLCSTASSLDGAINLPPPRKAHNTIGIRSLKHCSAWPLYGEPFGEPIDSRIAAPPNALEAAMVARVFAYRKTRLIASVLDSRAHLSVPGLDYSPEDAAAAVVDVSVHDASSSRAFSKAFSSDGVYEGVDGDSDDILEEVESEAEAQVHSESDSETGWAGFHDVESLSLVDQVAARRGGRAHKSRRRRWSVRGGSDAATAAARGGRRSDESKMTAGNYGGAAKVQAGADAAAVPFEVALVGRSNVGKSSLLNALLGLKWDDRRTQLAHVSRTPGKTRGANFWGCGAPCLRGTSAECMLVDLPGYGFAKGGEFVLFSFNK
jgi:hypothetical protein